MSSFGEELRRERELRRITLREVADATKINLRYLEALDKNDFKHLPGGVFNRGFVRAYAEYIGIDPEQMVTAYQMEEQAQSNSGPTDSGETVLRGTASVGPRAIDRPPARNSRTWVRMGVAVLLATALIAGGVIVYLKFFGGRTAASDAGTTDLPRTRTPSASMGANAPANDSTVAAVPISTRQPPTQPETTDDEDERAGGDVAKRSKVPAAAKPAATAASSPVADDSIHVTVFIDRATTGRLNCDNSQLELIQGMPPGTRIELTCIRFLVVDADDGGALRIGWPGVAPVAPGEAGVPLSGHRIEVRAQSARGRAGERP